MNKLFTRYRFKTYYSYFLFLILGCVIIFPSKNIYAQLIPRVWPLVANANVGVAANAYVEIKVIKGITYKIESATLWTTLTITDASNNQIKSFTPTVLPGTTLMYYTATYTGIIRLYPNKAGIITVSYESGANTIDGKDACGTDEWTEHFYKGQNFENYLGYYNYQNENFTESFAGNNAPLAVLSQGIHAIDLYSENFSVRFKMKSTKKGLYTVSVGSDDGSRLFVDEVKVYEWWSNHAYSTKNNQLINLAGNSRLNYEYYEGWGENRVSFQDLTRLIENTISGAQTICTGNNGTAITGDNFGALPAGITKSGTGFQWAYATTAGGTPTDISGATGQNYTPNTTAAPFNVRGVYYLYRKATLSSTNNFGIASPYVTTNLSNVVIVKVVKPTITLTSGNNTQTICNKSPIAPIIYQLQDATGATITYTTADGSNFQGNANFSGSYDAATGIYTVTATPDILDEVESAKVYAYTVTTTNANGCANVSATGTITVRALPNNTTSGFSGGYICPEETTVTLKYKALDKSFVSPYTIEYTDGATIWTQTIPDKNEFTFNVAVTPTATTEYTLISVTNGYGCKRTSAFGDDKATVNIIKITTQNTCEGGATVKFTQTDGMLGGTWAVSGGGTIVSNTGVFTPTTPGCFTATYTNKSGGKSCSASFVVFPVPPAPVITSAHNAPIVVQSPTSYADFAVQYSFDNGATWGANTPPTADNCAGYQIKTRYILKNACGSTPAGANIACAESPATTWVLDRTKPAFTPPNAPFNFCVQDIQQAGFNNLSADITPDRPEYYTFVKGNTLFDLNMTDFKDNCCTSGFTIHWKMDFEGGTPASISETGQPSAYNADIRFAGDGVNFQNKTHTISYWITDCNGNNSDTQKVNIIIKPRPKIENK